MSNHSLFFSLSIVFACIPVLSVQAQLLPDNTLGKENSVINSINSLEDKIDGGAIRGSNLFHSFKEFNIGNGKSVYFTNPTAIKNILNRVTGKNQSQILGKLGVLGNANLFLINPNGIVFGKDASLDINGSFVGSTAANILFEDGLKFSAASPDKPLLTISVPLGLGMGKKPGEIRVQGDRDKLANNQFGAVFRDDNQKSLELKPGKTIALIGGNIILESGSLKSNSGQIELGSVGSGRVDFIFTPDNLEFSYDGAESFQDIRLLQKSLLQVSSYSTIPYLKNAGSIQLQAKHISIQGGSIIVLDNRGNLPPKPININATESLKLLGNSSATETQFSGIRSQTFSAAKGGDINISTKQLQVQNGAVITAYGFGKNHSGNIQIQALDSLELSSALNKNFSVISSATLNDGNAGMIDIYTDQLTVRNGGVITSSSFAAGNAGNLTIDASEFIEVDGIEPINLQFSILSSTAFDAGNGGNVTINTQNLTVKNSGRVDASTVGSGSAGSMYINASDKIEITGYSLESIPSQIISSVVVPRKSTEERLGFSSNLTGESGAITINTKQLDISDGALLAVKNDGSGNAGKLQVKADSININQQGSISATTTSGEGGDIDLQTQNLLLRHNSNISATAGTGDGGNININTQILTALQNSDITANSQGSFGGKVTISAKGILGTQFREFITPGSDITATSGKGAEFNGVVDINTITINPNSGLVELPTGVTDSSNKIKAGCGVNSGNNFIATGRGGVSENPNQLFTVHNPTVDLIDFVSTSETNFNSISSENNYKKPKTEIVEARGWIRDAAGNIEFVAEVPRAIPNTKEIFQANCQSLS
ncbi:MAG: filamentous hemagglutinin N-terminal domain-containing protein [Cyanobacteria bacterium J06643_5]